MESQEETHGNQGLTSEITIEDLDLALKIIKIFMDRYNKAQRIMSRLGLLAHRSGRLEDRLVELFMNQRKPSIPVEEEAPSSELSPEERKRIEELKKQYLNK